MCDIYCIHIIICTEYIILYTILCVFAYNRISFIYYSILMPFRSVFAYRNYIRFFYKNILEVTYIHVKIPFSNTRGYIFVLRISSQKNEIFMPVSQDFKLDLGHVPENQELYFSTSVGQYIFRNRYPVPCNTVRSHQRD